MPAERSAGWTPRPKLPITLAILARESGRLWEAILSTTNTPGAIFVIDDSLIMRRLLETILTRAGREVVSFETGTEALAGLADAPVRPALVLLDAMLPDMDGAAVHAEIQSRHGAAAPPVVFVSGIPAEDLPAADGYIPKPFTPSTVLSAIEDVERRP